MQWYRPYVIFNFSSFKTSYIPLFSILILLRLYKVSNVSLRVLIEFDTGHPYPYGYNSYLLQLSVSRRTASTIKIGVLTRTSSSRTNGKDSRSHTNPSLFRRWPIVSSMPLHDSTCGLDFRFSSGPRVLRVRCSSPCPVPWMLAKLQVDVLFDEYFLIFDVMQLKGAYHAIWVW